MQMILGDIIVIVANVSPLETFSRGWLSPICLGENISWNEIRLVHLLPLVRASLVAACSRT